MQPGLGVTGLIGCLLLLGAHYALTDGVLMALASSLLPTARRGPGLAVVTTATSVTRLFASVLFGALWTQFGLRTGLAVFLTGLLLAVVMTRFVVRSDAVRGVDLKVDDGHDGDDRGRS
jgi:MFS family permease